MDLTIINICLIAIASFYVIRSIVWLFVVRSFHSRVSRELRPVVEKLDGILDNMSAITEAARDQMDELTTAVQDISYKTREVTAEIEEKIIPVFADFAGTLSGFSKVISLLFKRNKK